MTPLESQPPRWAFYWLRAAGIYNLAWGFLIIAFPHMLFDLTGMPRINYPEIWQCVGMIVGVYGIGYWIAASDSRRHWPIVLVGLLGKIFGPIGFAVALSRGIFPPAFGLTILTNDLLWWLPFTLILWDAFMHRSLRTTVKTQRFMMESSIAATPEDLFRFHESPDALVKLIPPGEPLRVVEPPTSLRPGTRVVLAGSILGLPLRWVAVHTEYDPPFVFADRQVSGPFESWSHRHLIRDNGQGGSILRDEIDYALPLGWVGELCAGWFVRKKLAAMFAYRHLMTRQAVESKVIAS